jgi:hypothetical protein
MGWREKHGLPPSPRLLHYPQNPDRRPQAEGFEGYEATSDDLIFRESGVVPFDQISKIVDSLEARFLGIRPKGWLPESEPAIPEQSVLAEVVRVLPDLIRHAWPLAVRMRLLARLRPGDQIVKVEDEFLLVTARPPRECYRVWRFEA